MAAEMEHSRGAQTEVGVPQIRKICGDLLGVLCGFSLRSLRLKALGSLPAPGIHTDY